MAKLSLPSVFVAPPPPRPSEKLFPPSLPSPTSPKASFRPHLVNRPHSTDSGNSLGTASLTVGKTASTETNVSAPLAVPIGTGAGTLGEVGKGTDEVAVEGKKEKVRLKISLPGFRVRPRENGVPYGEDETIDVCHDICRGPVQFLITPHTPTAPTPSHLAHQALVRQSYTRLAVARDLPGVIIPDPSELPNAKRRIRRGSREEREEMFATVAGLVRDWRTKVVEADGAPESLWPATERPPFLDWEKERAAEAAAKVAGKGEATKEGGVDKGEEVEKALGLESIGSDVKETPTKAQKPHSDEPRLMTPSMPPSAIRLPVATVAPSSPKVVISSPPSSPSVQLANPLSSSQAVRKTARFAEDVKDTTCASPSLAVALSVSSAGTGSGTGVGKSRCVSMSPSLSVGGSKGIGGSLRGSPGYLGKKRSVSASMGHAGLGAGVGGGQAEAVKGLMQGLMLERRALTERKEMEEGGGSGGSVMGFSDAASQALSRAQSHVSHVQSCGFSVAGSSVVSHKSGASYLRRVDAKSALLQGKMLERRAMTEAKEVAEARSHSPAMGSSSHVPGAGVAGPVKGMLNADPEQKRVGGQKAFAEFCKAKMEAGGK